jgi:hypothetical protein
VHILNDNPILRRFVADASGFEPVFGFLRGNKPNAERGNDIYRFVYLEDVMPMLGILYRCIVDCEEERCIYKGIANSNHVKGSLLSSCSPDCFVYDLE